MRRCMAMAACKRRSKDELEKDIIPKTVAEIRALHGRVQYPENPWEMVRSTSCADNNSIASLRSNERPFWHGNS